MGAFRVSAALVGILACAVSASLSDDTQCLLSLHRRERSAENTDQGVVALQLMRKRLDRQLGTEEPATCEASDSCDRICTAEVTDEDVPTFKMRVLASDEYISRVALCNGDTWEFGSVKDLMLKVKDASGAILDIGANLGSWTLPLAASGRSVVAVEVSPGIANFLQECLAINAMGQVSVHNVAVVSPKEAGKTICMGATDAELLEGLNAGGNQVNLGNRDFCKQEVSSTTLDQLYQTDPQMRKVVAMKIDCEGCEGQALMGGRQFLSEVVPCVIAMELTEKYLCDSGVSINELKSFLEDIGYNTSTMLTQTDGTCEDHARQVASGKLGVVQNFIHVERHNFNECIGRHRQ